MRKGGLIFVSCGQVTTAEKALGREACALVRELTPHEPYFAENQNTLEGLTQNILGSLDEAVGLIAIMHPRGSVTIPDKPQEIRGSVWIEQEIAVAAFITQILKRPLKIAPYIHRGIRLEGMREQLLLHAVKFTESTEVLDHLHKLLPEWRDLPASLKISGTPNFRIALKHGHHSNFLIEYTNDEDEPIFVRQVRLFGGKDGKIELTEPLTPENPTAWKVGPHSSIAFGKTIVQQRNPAVGLVRMYSNAGIMFNTDIVLIATIEMRDQSFQVQQNIYVKVNATNNTIIPLV